MMSNWQEWAVIVIVLICLSILIYKLVNFFKRAGANENPCSGCELDCKLKSELKSRKVGCTEKGDEKAKKTGI